MGKALKSKPLFNTYIHHHLSLSLSLPLSLLIQFNVTISDDKHVNSELKRSLEGRLPQPGQPVTLEIHMETQEVIHNTIETLCVILRVMKLHSLLFVLPGRYSCPGGVVCEHRHQVCPYNARVLI